ncbi:putative adhesin [Paludibacterium yongneupense]|uniref:putative adhesin n=1 Tax=Paludibacterium yongneupense TaxID=400061 RepID=UPI000425D850|nr:hypothetical protein [Paludibacterium yongneupense]
MAKFVLQVSGHAQVRDKVPFPVAGKWRFMFFVRQGEELDYPTSEKIYAELAASQFTKVDSRVVETYSTGDNIDDYVLWDLEDARYVSGVLLAGSTQAVVDIAGTTEQKSITLSNLLTLAIEQLNIEVGKDDVTVYFNACR